MGQPSFFITLTRNLYWAQIQAALRPGQTPADRPDIAARAFHGRLAKTVTHLNDRFCGRRKYTVEVIEYRGKACCAPTSFSASATPIGAQRKSTDTLPANCLAMAPSSGPWYPAHDPQL